MHNTIISFQAELMKLKRSMVVKITFALFIFIPVMMGVLMYLSMHPELAAKLGIVGAKAQFFSENSWIGFLDIINQLIAVLGIIGFGFITSWVFGREYIDHTMTDLLALPVSRSHIIYGKHLVLFIWCTLLALALFTSAVITGFAFGIPEFSKEIIFQYFTHFMTITLLIIMLNPLTALITSSTKGIFAPIGFVIIMVILAQFSALGGFGAFFPFSIPGVFAVSLQNDDIFLLNSSYLIIIFTFLVSIYLTTRQWKGADH